MGPRPDGRGRQIAARARWNDVIKRQWGRDRMAAEGGYTAAGIDLGVPRQWGRDRMAAEGVAGDELARRRAQASMGPRPDGRGRAIRRL